MDFEEESIARKLGAEVFSFPPSVWNRIGCDVRNGVLEWVRSKRKDVSEEEYWDLLKECGKVLDKMGL